MDLILDATPEDLKVFLEEAEEHIQALDADLLMLEKAGADQELLQEIFRAAHTLKGSSASIGHTRMAQLTHAMESVFDALRQGQLGVSTELVDTLLESLDGLKILNNEVATLKITDLDMGPVIARLNDIVQRSGEEEASPCSPENATGPADLTETELFDHEDDGRTLYKIVVEVDENAPLLSARGIQILLELTSIAKIIRSTPTQAQIEKDGMDRKLEIVCASLHDPDYIHNALANIVDVVSVEIEPFAPELSNERLIDLGPENVNCTDERRVIDLGPKARGKSSDDKLRMAADKLNQLSKTVRIDVERLDNLMNLVGELVIDNTRIAQLAHTLQLRYDDDEYLDRLSEAASHLGRLTDELQQEIMKSRMQPVENVFNKFPRMVRNLAQKAGKDIDFVVQGQETELDRTVIEEIGDPLIHLLRNSVDHGIEPPAEREAKGKDRRGQIKLSAYHQENHIVICVEDDGRGIDPAKIRTSAINKGLISQDIADRLTEQESIELIFASGFSTAEKISDVSGRGVGMDIVRTNIERLNGSVNIESTPGRGSKFTIKLPLTLAIIRALLISVSEQVYSIPLVFVTETMRIDVDTINRVNKRDAVQVRGQVLPLLRLNDLFSMSSNGHKDEKKVFVVAIKYAGQQVGLIVDRLIGEQEVVIKTLGKYMGDIKGISGAAILGDGHVGLILDAPALVQVAVDEQMGRLAR